MRNKKSSVYPLASVKGFALLSIILVCSVFFAVRYGSADMSLSEFFSALLFCEDSKTASAILYLVRLPRAIAAIIAGVGLSLSGVLLQSVTDNSLAGPNIIGVNAGAGLAVVVTLAIFPTAFTFLPMSAFVGAFAATALIVSMSGRGRGSKSSIVLAGVAVTSLLNAAISVFTLLDADILSSFNSFSVGGFAGVSYERLWLPAIVVLACLVVSSVISSRINLLCLGDRYAQSLGVSVGAVRLVAVICASASAAAVVSFAGLLGFVGLVVPHIARKLVGNKTNVLIAASAFLGATVTVLADLLGRVLAAPSEIPVGIMMAFIGAPFFIHLLMRRRDT